MSTELTAYPLGRTALIVMDALNDFISEGGKLWEEVKDVVNGVDMLPHMTQVIDAARAAGIPVLHAPMETNEWDYSVWKNLSLSTNNLGEFQIFQAGTWGQRSTPTSSRSKATSSWCRTRGSTRFTAPTWIRSCVSVGMTTSFSSAW